MIETKEFIEDVEGSSHHKPIEESREDYFGKIVAELLKQICNIKRRRRLHNKILDLCYTNYNFKELKGSFILKYTDSFKLQTSKSVNGLKDQDITSQYSRKQQRQKLPVLIMSLQAIVDENKQVIFDDNGNIFVYNSLNNCATYMEDTAENRNLLNMPLQNDEMIGQGSNANCSVDKTKDDGPRWTHDKILLLFSLYQDNINLFKSAKKTNNMAQSG
ncbi:hypothetical protein FQA39_LY11185 [Lamprigera yunnana]|nr:hypothetical protein FQA39_LY11185 [Lamprigera yunnana]